MNYEETLCYIHSFQKFRTTASLTRMRRLMQRLGNPQDHLKFIHVVGTNGKGSTAAMCAEILKLAGYRCGMYTSPFITDFRERFQMNGNMISRQELIDYTSRVRQTVEELSREGIEPTEFELITALAFLWFYESGCEIVVLEAGLGGTYDSTNVIQTPLVAAVVSISLDHVRWLGDTVTKIARSKAGVIKRNGVCVCYPKQDIDAVAVLMEQCAKENARFVQANPNAVRVLESSFSKNRFLYEETEYTLELVGEHQIFNAVNVIEIMKQVRKRGFAVSDACIRQGIAQTVFPARFEYLHRSPDVVVDGAHNAEGMRALANTLSTVQADSKTVMMGMLADKDYELSMKAIAKQADRIVCVTADSPRAVDCRTLAECAKKYCADVSFEDDKRIAFRNAYRNLGKNGFLLICGSFFTAGPLREIALEELSDRSVK